jgi:S-adenosylmethionine/arginine decarboxylase-like enzyme
MTTNLIPVISNQQQLDQLFKEGKLWGLLTSIDLHGCNPETIRSAEKLKEYVVQLCKLIDMKRFGDTVCIDFGDNPKVSGFSMTQLIETSLISGHFANLDNSAYIDIFSCKYYNTEIAAEFTRKFFGAKECKLNFIPRGIK